MENGFQKCVETLNGVYLHSSEYLKVLLKIQWIFVIILGLFAIGNFRGTCSFVEMPKGYMAKQRLEAPGLKPR